MSMVMPLSSIAPTIAYKSFTGTSFWSVIYSDASEENTRRYPISTIEYIATLESLYITNVMFPIPVALMFFIGTSFSCVIYSDPIAR